MHSDPLNSFRKDDSWREFQSEYISRRRRKALIRKSAAVIAAVCFAALIIIGGVYTVKHSNFSDRFLDDRPKDEVTQKPEPKPARTLPMLSKSAVRDLTRDMVFLNKDTRSFPVKIDGRSYTVQTRLTPDLQAMLIKRLDRLKTLTRGKPQRIAIVAMDGKTGFIRAMTGFDLADNRANPCIVSDYPAASIFKIITASAAVDSLGYTAGTPMHFNGNKYTLYKRQITEKKNKYTSRVSLSSAFAQSINPVFGKLGQLYLGRETLDTYASGFGFNLKTDADFEFQSGFFDVEGSDYHLAELGCGFNRDTRISPVFGAVLVSAVVNRGQSLVPRMVDKIKDADGKLLFKSKKEIHKTAMPTNVAGQMVEIMKKTISHGTARKAFKGHSRDKILSGLTLGGKTGSLFNRERTVKYDWFTGFGIDKNSGKSLVVSVVVGHRKYIGTKAATHARAVLKTYFKDRS